MSKQEFYEAIDPSTLDFTDPDPSYEGTVLFTVANFQYLVTCLAFSIAYPFRRPFWSNGYFLLCVIFIITMNLLCVYAPADSLVPEYFNLKPLETVEDGIAL